MNLKAASITTFVAFLIVSEQACADRFLLATFNNSEQKLRVLDSTNAASFEGYGNGINYTPPAGNALRDPSLVFYRGRYLLCHTAGNFGGVNYFSVLTSPDAKTWTHLVDVSMASIGNVRWTWAPEWFLDDNGSLHVLVSASTTEQITIKHTIYELHPLDPNDLRYWSTPAPITGPVAFPPWTESDTWVGTYDPYVVKRGNAYWLFFFNVRSSTIELARSTDALTGPYEPQRTNNWQGIGTYKEGPSVLYLGGGRWRMIYADAINSFLSYTDSTNNWHSWSSPQPVSLPGAPTNFTVNHGTLFIPPGGLELGTSLRARPGGGFDIRFNAQSGDLYRLWTATDFANWSATKLLGPAGAGETIEPVETGVAAKQFWRLERLIPE